jgi:ubiquitin C-terminal hydrolase
MLPPENNESVNGFTNNDNSFTNSQFLRLKNYGSTCYLNTALQCLYNINELIDIIIKHSSQSEICFVLLRTFTESNPIYVYNFLKKKYPDRYNGQQEDGNGLVQLLLDLIHESIKKYYRYNIFIRSLETNGPFSDEIRKGYVNHFKTEGFSPIYALFLGQNIRITRCSDCQHVNYGTECFMDILLENKNGYYNQGSHGHDFHDSLGNYWSTEKLQDYKCDKCSGTNVEKKMILTHLPKYFIINSATRSLIKTFSINKNNKKYKFQLNSTIKYIGNSYSGHYFNIISRPTKSVMKNRGSDFPISNGAFTYYVIDDESIRPLNNNDHNENLVSTLMIFRSDQ